MMDRLTENKIILIKRKTRLEELIIRYNTISQVQFYIENLGADFSDYLNEDEKYKKSILTAKAILDDLGNVQVVDRQYISNFIFGDDDVIVAIGQDGIVANTLKYLSSQPLIGVNPDPLRWDGVLLPFVVSDLKLVVADVLKQKRQIKEVTLAKAELNDGQVLYGVNDLFIGQKTHVSARYQIRLGDIIEQHSSSGIIISTGLGSTGWLKSILTGASNIMDVFNKNNISLSSQNISWNTNKLFFTVREPFPSKNSQASLVFGSISANSPLKIVSQMPENGVIFSDGIENDYLQFNSGVEATISLAGKKGHLVV